MIMNLRQFIQIHREDWQLLEQLMTTMNKNKRNISGDQVDRFHRTYLKVTQSLSYSQTYFPNEDVTHYLNELVAKAHNLLYRDHVSSFSQMKHFFSEKFIQLLTEQQRFVIAALILFTLGALGGFIAVLDDPLHAYSILPAEMSQGVDPNQVGSEDGISGSSLMSAAIMTNNIRVAFLAFAGGITFGLLTVYVLIFNGILVGALAGMFWHTGLTYQFWAYIVPHGIIELTAIFIAGGAGLLMGYKLIAPGPYTRGYQLKTQAKRSVQLLIGTIPLFIIAGIIEGYITPSTISLELKYVVAFVTIIGLILYVAIGHMLIRRRESLQ